MTDLPTPGLKFDGTISLSAILVMIGMTLGGISFLYANVGDAKITQANLTTFQRTVEANSVATNRQIDLAFGRVEAAIGNLQQQIKDIPDLAARVALVERQIRDNEARNATQDSLILAMRERQIQGLADIAANKTEIGSLRQAINPQRRP